MNDNNKKSNQNNDNNQKTPQQSGGFDFFSMIILALILVICSKYIMEFFSSAKVLNIRYDQFINLVDSGNVEAVEITRENYELKIQLKQNFTKEKVFEILEINSDSDKKLLQNQLIYLTGMIEDPGLKDFLFDHNVKFKAGIPNLIMSFFISWILPVLIFMVVLRLFYGRLLTSSKDSFSNMMNIGKSSAKVYNKGDHPNVTFKDVAGLEEAKESLYEIVDFLHNPAKYVEIGAKLPKGALLVGPPGTGKTLLAKAIAGEANVPFFSLSASEFMEMYVGVGAKRVRDLFGMAQKESPCIIFIDEIDAIGKRRDNQIGSNDEREQTLNQLLAEMDGFDSSKAIIILAATNRPEILDKALLRPGRFDRQIIVDKPDLKGREEILQVHAEKVKLESNVNLKQIALATSGASGADLANIINEAALHAVKNNRKTVIQEDLMEAVETIIAGKEKKDRILSEKEKRIVAYHEVGHALAAALQKHSQPVQKITIVPRTMGALGYTMQMPEEDKFLYTKDELLEQIVVLLSGRSAEKIKFDKISTGASNDIERATKIARDMVTIYGMSDKFSMMALESVETRYLDGRKLELHSELTGSQIDLEVLQIIEGCYKKSLDLLETRTEKLDEIADYLFKKETITGEEFMNILNR